MGVSTSSSAARLGSFSASYVVWLVSLAILAQLLLRPEVVVNQAIDSASRQNKTKQNKTKQNKTKQNKTKQSKAK